jgi:hypothetical protein
MIDVRAVFEEEIAEKLARHPELAEQVNAVIQVEILGEGGGVWTIDLTKQNAPPKVIPGEHPKPKARVRVAHDDFVALMAGQERWTDAFVRGKIEYKGDFMFALKMRKLFASLTGDQD